MGLNILTDVSLHPFKAKITVPSQQSRIDSKPLMVLFNTREASGSPAVDAVAGSTVFTFERTLNPLPTYVYIPV